MPKTDLDIPPIFVYSKGIMKKEWSRQSVRLWTMKVNRDDLEQIATLAQKEGLTASAAVRAAVRRALQDQTERPATKAEALAINRP